MTLQRWLTQYNIIDYTPASAAEDDFVRSWIFDNRDVLHNVQTNDGIYTFKAINAVIGEFVREVDTFELEDLDLQEMEAYFNEH